MSTQVSEKQARRVAEAARQTEWRLPSFGKELFLGRFRLDLLHPQPEPDPAMAERGERFLGELRSLLENKVDPLRIEREARIPDDVIDALKQIGALGMKIPGEYGGLGLSQVYYNRALALAGQCHSSLSTLLSAHQSIGVPEPLRLFGSEEQKRRVLPLVATTHISAFLLTEPDVGSDPARMAMQAVPTEDGTGYRLSGRKLWTTNGVIADLLVVMAVVPASADHHGGITAFIVDAASEGITVEHRNQFMGLRGIENGVTRFADVFVPNENVIQREGAGLKIALTTLNTGRLSLPAMCAGIAKWGLKIAREWSGERVQWGRPIGKHEVVAEKVAAIAGSAFGLEAMVEVASRMADDQRNDVRIEAALAKLYGSELGWRVADDLVQVRGGRGYETAASLAARGEKPIPVEQVLRDMRINRIFEGSTEIMHLLIAREAVDTHLSVAGDIVDPDVPLRAKAKTAIAAGSFYARWLPTLATGDGQKLSSYAEFGELAGHLRYVERSSRKLARSTFYAMSRWQGRLERKQGFLGRIVDIGAELFGIAAACVHARTIAADEPEHGGGAVEIADLYCTQARRRAEQLFARLWHNDDTASYAAAQQVLSGRYRWFEEGVLDPSGEGPLIAGQPDW